jgi:SAM-dependent methyltransferase
MDAPAENQAERELERTDPADLRGAQEHSRRANSFGAAAEDYARHRPDYPLAAIRWALEPITAPASRPVRILDLGAGTGKLTAQLASLTAGGRRPEVVAVEPDPQMLAELRRTLPGVTAVEGRAEAIPLPDHSVDAVLAGQAAHWFNLDRALPEIARVLTQGGVFAALWNTDDDRVDWVAGLHRATRRRNVVARTTYFDQDDGISAWLRGPGRELFGPPEGSGFEHVQVRTAESLIATMRTHSMFLIMEPAERETVLSRVRDYLAGSPQTESGEFMLPIWTVTLRSVTRPGPG